MNCTPSSSRPAILSTFFCQSRAPTVIKVWSADRGQSSDHTHQHTQTSSHTDSHEMFILSEIVLGETHKQNRVNKHKDR